MVARNIQKVARQFRATKQKNLLKLCGSPVARPYFESFLVARGSQC